MRHLRFFAVFLFLGGTSIMAQPPAISDALDGVDPVVLLQQNKEVMGKSEYTVVRGRFKYFFSSPETRTTFEKEPAKYEIALSGQCARMGKAVYGNAADYVVHDGKIYIFGSDGCHKAFAEAPEKYIPKPAAPMPAAAAARAQGKELIDRAVARLGGAARLDAVTTYVETVSQVQKRPQGESKFTTKTMYRFPGDMRVDRTNQRPDGQSLTFGTIVTPTELFGAFQGQTRPIIAGARPSLELDFGRHPVALLHARHNKGFVAASLGSATVGGVTVDQVRVQNGAVDVTLGLEPKTAQLHSISFVDRGPDGAYGIFTVIYSGFRDVAGLLLPHETRSEVNGAPEQVLTASVQSIEVNVPLDAALFTMTAAEKK
jgi:YHS domain-containing protein